MEKTHPLAYNLSQAAEALHVSRPTMSNLIRVEGFPVLKIGRRYVIPVDAFREWLGEQAYNKLEVN